MESIVFLSLYSNNCPLLDIEYLTDQPLVFLFCIQIKKKPQMVKSEEYCNNIFLVLCFEVT